jgi:hypothetical protein
MLLTRSPHAYPPDSCRTWYSCAFLSIRPNAVTTCISTRSSMPHRTLFIDQSTSTMSFGTGRRTPGRLAAANSSRNARAPKSVSTSGIPNTTLSSLSVNEVGRVQGVSSTDRWQPTRGTACARVRRYWSTTSRMFANSRSIDSSHWQPLTPLAGRHGVAKWCLNLQIIPVGCASCITRAHHWLPYHGRQQRYGKSDMRRQWGDRAAHGMGRTSLPPGIVL